MPSQFIRLSGYGAHPRRGRKPNESAAHILAEAWRVPGSTPHIVHPSPPNVLYGQTLSEVEAGVEDMVRSARTTRGARIPRDGIVLYAIVVSYPVPWRNLATEQQRLAYQNWRDQTVEWLRKSFGDHLRAILEHVDERFPHLHAQALPRLGQFNRIDHSGHPGYASRLAAARNGADHKQREHAFREGMRAWQDQYHIEVSRHFGHDRLGPKRQRFRRDIALVRRSLNEILSAATVIALQVRVTLAAHRATIPEIAADYDKITMLESILKQTQKKLLAGNANALHDLEIVLRTLDHPQPALTTMPTRFDIEGLAASPQQFDGADRWGHDDDPRSDDFDGDAFLNNDHDDDASPEDDFGHDLDDDLETTDEFWDPMQTDSPDEPEDDNVS